jgi:Tfp pilus assembly protein PilV
MNRGKRTKLTGTIMLDTLMAVFALSLGAAAFFALMPQVDRLERLARQNAVALHVATRMIDQLQMMKGNTITAANLTALNLITSGQTQSPYSFSTIPVDNATNYSPAETLKNGTGTLTVTPIDNGSVLCTVEIDWTSDAKKTEKLVTGTVIGGYR